ncbi:M23 family metallopeptidase [bacterium 210820-DFI.6.37]|nr:M23 family metallopeptidase [bacterium 210820-DFI.6.37]
MANLKIVVERVTVTESSAKKTTTNMASWGKQKFKVSSKEATALTTLEIKDTYNDDYDESGKKVGRELTTFTANVTYFTPVAGTWGDARSAMQQWRSKVGKKAYFYLNGKKLFSRKCRLLGVSSGGFSFTNNGKVLAVELSLEFKWARTAAQEKAAKKAAKSSATKTSSSSKKSTSKSSSTYKGGKMSWPLPGHKSVSSNYGPRNCPFHGRETHSGIDIPAPYGTAIVAAAPGTVVLAGRNGSYGNCVIIKHSSSIWTLYGHCATLLVKKGDKVKEKQKIAKVDSTGNSTGNHLHFEVRKGANKHSNHTSPWNYVSK